MKLIVLDASVAIKWFVPEESGRSASINVLADVEQNPKNYIVPELFFCEMLAVLCRLSKVSTSVERYLYLLEGLGLHRVGHGSELLSTAARLAVDHQVSGCDAVYAATAKLMSATWLTADEKAHRKLSGTKLTLLLGSR